MRFSSTFLVGLLLRPVFGVVVETTNDADDKQQALRRLRESLSENTVVGNLNRLAVDISLKGKAFSERLQAQKDIDLSSFALAPTTDELEAMKQSAFQLHQSLTDAHNINSNNSQNRKLAVAASQEHLQNLVQTMQATLQAEEQSSSTTTHGRQLQDMESLRDAIAGIASAMEQDDYKAFISHMRVVKDSLRAMVDKLQLIQQGDVDVVESILQKEIVMEPTDQEQRTADLYDVEPQALERIWIHLFKESNDYVNYFINEIELQGTLAGGLLRTFLLPVYFTVVAFIYLSTTSGFQCVLASGGAMADCERIPFVEQQKWHQTAGSIAAASVERENGGA